jgi:hypothetical protein
MEEESDIKQTPNEIIISRIEEPCHILARPLHTNTEQVSANPSSLIPNQLASNQLPLFDIISLLSNSSAQIEIL